MEQVFSRQDAATPELRPQCVADRPLPVLLPCVGGLRQDSCQCHVCVQRDQRQPDVIHISANQLLPLRASKFCGVVSRLLAVAQVHVPDDQRGPPPAVQLLRAPRKLRRHR
jgi:hypothetical protein